LAGYNERGLIHEYSDFPSWSAGNTSELGPGPTLDEDTSIERTEHSLQMTAVEITRPGGPESAGSDPAARRPFQAPVKRLIRVFAAGVNGPTCCNAGAVRPAPGFDIPA